MVDGPAASLGGFVFGHDWGSNGCVGFCCLVMCQDNICFIWLWVIIFLLGLFFLIIRNYAKCDKLYFWHLRNWNLGIFLSYFGFCMTRLCSSSFIHLFSIWLFVTTTQGLVFISPAVTKTLIALDMLIIIK